MIKKREISIIGKIPFDEINVIWNEDASGDAYVDMLCTLVRKCGEYCIPTAVLHVSRGTATPPYNETGLARIQKIICVAEQCNVNIAFENLRYIHYLDYVFSNLSSEKLKFCYDSGHHNYMSPERNLLADFGDKLVALHLDDNMGDSDIHMLPFDGTADWNQIIDNLAKTAYDGVISLEVQQDRHEMYKDLPPDEYLDMAFDRALRFEAAFLK
ncbi:MAG: sugar phosphate isomerase/epimerase family protein, partial [Saccharofermentanales bacterium]